MIASSGDFDNRAGGVASAYGSASNYTAAMAVDESEIQPKNHLGWSIALSIFTLFAILVPIGIVGLFYSLKVNKLWESGDQEGARVASEKAALYNKYIGIASFIVWIIYMVLIRVGVIQIPTI